MQCPSCGSQNKADARFCASCGLLLEAEPQMLQAGQLMDGGTYRIIRPLGKGGMGAVYLAANTKAFDRQCVIKEVIEYYDVGNAEERQKALQRFEVEARILATLKHQGIPDIYAYFSENGRNYLVMEYIQGPDLAEGLTRERDDQIVKGQPYKAHDVIGYMAQICEVLVYLEQHQPPVIHNDIKPANIIIDENTGRAVLVDFGTAKTRYSQQSAGQPGLKKSSVYGTVGFAAPELYDGKAEPRSDVYALAATAYHLLTDDDPRLHPFQFPKMESIPQDLRIVLREALAVEAEDRLSAVELSKRLESLLNDKPPQLPALTFPAGDKATSRVEMIDLSVKHWDYASDILYDGSIGRWLSGALHDPAAARAAQEAVKRHADDANAGLEYLIRSLDPKAIPAAQLELVTAELKVESAGDQDRSQQIQIKNAGGGYLYGKVTSSVKWLQVDGRLACAPGEVQALPVVIQTQELTPGNLYKANVNIEVSTAQSAVIPVEVKVPSPVVDVSPAHVELEIPSIRELRTERGSFQVVNRGRVRAECWIDGKPDWLVLIPEGFVCAPKETQVVELVGRVDKLPDRTRANNARLQLQIKGGRPKTVEVIARHRPQRGERLKSFLLISLAVAILGAAIWVVLFVLPGLKLF